MPAVLQRSLPLVDTRFRPTVGMDGAKHLLDLSEREVLALVDDHLITHAWNIGLGDRREIRFLRRALDAYLAWQQQGRGRLVPAASPKAAQFPSTCNLQPATSNSMLLPPGHSKPFLTNGELQRALNCVSDHVLNLVEARELALQPGTTYERGRYGSALITVPSFTDFLSRRRL